MIQKWKMDVLQRLSALPNSERRERRQSRDNSKKESRGKTGCINVFELAGLQARQINLGQQQRTAPRIDQLVTEADRLKLSVSQKYLKGLETKWTSILCQQINCY